MTWREKLRRRVCGLWWAKRHGRMTGDFRIPAAGLHPQHLVIILPPDFHDFDVARHVVKPLVLRMGPRQCTLLVRENFRTWLPEWGSRLISYDLRAAGFLGFPKRPMLHKVAELAADVVLDLTPRFCPFTAALAAATRAPLRISLDHEEENVFFNFFLRLDNAKTLAERYDTLLRYV